MCQYDHIHVRLNSFLNFRNIICCDDIFQGDNETGRYDRGGHVGEVKIWSPKL